MHLAGIRLVPGLSSADEQTVSAWLPLRREEGRPWRSSASRLAIENEAGCQPAAAGYSSSSRQRRARHRASFRSSRRSSSLSAWGSLTSRPSSSDVWFSPSSSVEERSSSRTSARVRSLMNRLGTEEV